MQQSLATSIQISIPEHMTDYEQIKGYVIGRVVEEMVRYAIGEVLGCLHIEPTP